MNINRVQHVHLIGIGGIGMSALARFLVHEKKTVTGTNDIASPKTLADLEDMGVTISYDMEQLPEADMYVYSEAWHSIAPELLAQANATKKPVVNYFEALGMAANPYYLVAVAGTHGKTTTTAMLTDVFEAAEKDPTAIIGSLRAKTNSNYRPGKSKYAIVEACEFRRDFLHLTPDVLVILNLEHEHVDYYQSLAEVQTAFRELIAQVHETGVVVTNPKDPNIAPIVADAPVPVIDYTEHLDLQLPLKAPGMHNKLNAAAALAVAQQEKLPSATARQALTDFAGTWRRFEYKGEYQGAPVYDDYAHHPTEIKAALAGARELYPDRRIVAVFQPHTYSRTKTLFDEFAKAFRDADEVIVAPIYAARETDTLGVTGRELAVKMISYTPNAHYQNDLKAIVAHLEATVGQNDVVLVLGAGPITEVASTIVT
jgi:UDP-N-acetylmuramate--alanine ligase